MDKKRAGLIPLQSATCLTNTGPPSVPRTHNQNLTGLPNSTPTAVISALLTPSAVPTHPHVERKTPAPGGCMADTAEVMRVLKAKGQPHSSSVACPLRARLVKGLSGSAGFTTEPADTRFLLRLQRLRIPSSPSRRPEKAAAPSVLCRSQ
ncbi:unnamed protein product [Pleuronectes platessa]|uniref:Uncharacterized protein n=1 Tax=Pleuronectes platessa TaxID=8262 RepID=A0A9N7YP00_PLEPL|nr:unnamed protein product [Pleuronectes platessa]